GQENAKKATLIIAQNSGSPIIPTEGSAYIGDFPSNGTATGIFRTSVASSADAQTYPLDVYVKYENTDGDMVSSDIETIGVPVGGKIDFEITSDPQTIKPGQKKVITAKFKNTGDATAYQAVARISMVDPFSSNDDSAFLGDLAPGETKEASFLVTAESTATVKNYGIDSEIRYRDALDNSVISDSMKLDVTVVPATSMTSVLTDNPALLAALAVLIIAIGGYLLYRRKKLQ
ncbi:MAG: S-layer protein, partial [Methanoregula sp.]